MEFEPTFSPERSEKKKQSEDREISSEEVFINESLEERLTEEELDFKTLKVGGNEEFSKALAIEKEDYDEKKVRLYRGVNSLDKSVLDQVPYGMRAIDKNKEIKTIESAGEKIEDYLKNPTYENFINYVKEVTPYLNNRETKKMEMEIKSIEECILNGSSIKKELLFRQNLFNGGSYDIGPSPYLSASRNPYEAAGYGSRGGIIVLDIPEENIDSFNSDSDEIYIEGKLKKEYIAAIISRGNTKGEITDKAKEDLESTLEELEPLTNSSIYNTDELSDIINRSVEKRKEEEEKRWKKDVEMVRRKRAERLTEKFPEVDLKLSTLTERAENKGVDFYTCLMRGVFDYYETELKSIGRRGRDIENYTYDQGKKFKKENINEEMLLKLRKLVNHLKEKEESF